MQNKTYSTLARMIIFFKNKLMINQSSAICHISANLVYLWEVMLQSHKGKRWSETTAQPKLLQQCALNLQACCLWNGCLKSRDQVCDHLQSITDLKANLVHRDSNKTTIRRSHFAISLWLNRVTSSNTCKLQKSQIQWHVLRVGCYLHTQIFTLSPDRRVRVVHD